jgi:hypothetical protein
MQHDDLFTVEQLCDFAGLRYGMLLGNDRVVHLISGGGHRKSKVLFIDLDLVPAATDQRWRVL